MKTIKAILTAYICSILASSAAFSQHVILDPSSKKSHKKYQPTITEDSKNKDFVYVSVPFFDEGLSYWLVVADKKLDKKLLNFRNMIWENKIPNHIQMIVPCSQRIIKLEDETIKFKSITFRVKKENLNKVYIYHDYPHGVLDGGYYYTYDLSAYIGDLNKQKTPAPQ